MPTTSNRAGFTLVELLLTITIMALLLALTAPAVQSAREAARKTECQSHQHQIAIALQSFHDIENVLPPAHWQAADNPPALYPGYPWPGANQRGYYYSWMARILPYIERNSEHSRIDFSSDGVMDPWPHPQVPLPGEPYLNSLEFQVYRCPSDPRHRGAGVFAELDDGRIFEIRHTSYLGVNGTDQFAFDGAIFVNSRVNLTSILDGTTNTFLIGERPPTRDGWFGWWFADAGMKPWFGSPGVVLGTNEIIHQDFECFPWGPTSANYQPVADELADDGQGYELHAWHFWSYHPGGAYFAFADGSVRFIPYNISPAIFTAHGTIADDLVADE